MADISAFPTMHDVLKAGDNIQTLTATTDVKAGQVVAINATGVSLAVDPSVATAGSRSIGVALYDATAGNKVAVAMSGCIVDVANADDTAEIDAGSFVETNNNAVKGTVNAAAVADIAGAVAVNHLDIIGIALEDILISDVGKIMILPMTLVQVQNA